MWTKQVCFKSLLLVPGTTLDSAECCHTSCSFESYQISIALSISLCCWFTAATANAWFQLFPFKNVDYIIAEETTHCFSVFRDFSLEALRWVFSILQYENISVSTAEILWCDSRHCWHTHTHAHCWASAASENSEQALIRSLTLVVISSLNRANWAVFKKTSHRLSSNFLSLRVLLPGSHCLCAYIFYFLKSRLRFWLCVCLNAKRLASRCVSWLPN